MILLKFICLTIYSLAVVVFLYYVNISYLYSFYKDWLFCDFKNKSYFDYIIVGAGSAGSILATRLSNAGAKVLLIEAGGAPSYFFNIPIIAPLLMNTVYDWQYKTVPQENACKGLKNSQSNWAAGKILGGSSRLNYMVYVQGHPEDYNSWFSDFKEPNVKNGGPLHVDNQNWHSQLSDPILQGVFEMSHSFQNIYNASLSDFKRADLTIKDGERWSTDRVIYQFKNERLKILTNSLVTKVLFKSNKAVGVELVRHKRIFKTFARRGVILSAGTVGTSKLLMLSGVGPKQHLKELSIKTKVDLPVGQHLIDHIITGLDLVILNNDVALSVTDVINPYSMIEYYLFGRGPWTSAGVDVTGIIYSKLEANTSAPNLQIMVLPIGLSQDNGILLRKNLGILEEVYNEYFEPLAHKVAITIAPVLLHPKSMGEVRLKSSNPFDAPVIDPRYLSNEDDVLTLIEGIKFVKELVQTKAMKKLGAQLYKKPFPGCESFVFDTIKYWKCYIRHLSLTTYHPAGTCRMGNVVDSKFRVYKTENLFVIDASVFPKLPSGNINAPVIMLSEKAAKLLIEDFKKFTTVWQKCYKNDIFFSLYKCY